MESVQKLLKEMNTQNTIHLNSRNGNRSANILSLEKQINDLGYVVEYKYGSFVLVGA